MTASEMVISFKQGLDKFDSKNYPNLEPEEIDLVLNQAQDAFVKQRYGYNNIKKESFEETQKRTEDLKALIVTQNITPLANTSDNINSNANFITLPADHWITIQELTNLTFTDCGVSKTEDVFTLGIQHNDYSKIISNPFAKPTDEKVLRLMTKEGVELLHSPTSTINSYKIRYIKRPVRIDSSNLPNVDCELSEHTHQEIVNTAIMIALENIETNRINTYSQIVLNKTE